ncbi:hypothetical protein [Vulcaniibacterium gelatinicum]|uniref:hypothetical protein n=1 Tax=Vulcaniibacterium gelatinicum TaxID=2598725 RepID=UPI0011CA4383|nr:hypothetical protein [Vulcaniibacterium gelatinicum]
MSPSDRLQQDLAYVASAVRHHERTAGVPAIYFLWAAVIAVGFALPDVAPRQAGPFWLVAGPGGGLLSWWLAARAERRRGVNDVATGRRHGLHWLIGGAGFLLVALPALAGRVSGADAAPGFLLVAGLLYALAGVHLERPLLWSGLLMLVAYAVLVLFAPPYAWTLTGATIALALAWAGLWARRVRVAEAAAP